MQQRMIDQAFADSSIIDLVLHISCNDTTEKKKKTGKAGV
jgi:hypothetical protein